MFFLRVNNKKKDLQNYKFLQFPDLNVDILNMQYDEMEQVLMGIPQPEEPPRVVIGWLKNTFNVIGRVEKN